MTDKLNMTRRLVRRIAAASIACLATLVLVGCAGPKLEDHAADRPVFDFKQYFNGNLLAHGLVSDRGGRVLRRFVVTMRCEWVGDAGTLDEQFTYSDGERQQLTGLIGRQIAALYARRVLADRGAALSIIGAQPVGAGEELVSSRLTRRDGAVESIDWLVRRRGTGGFGIFDIVSDGQSLAAGKRSEYAILLQRSRGDVAGLIEALRLDRQ